MTPGARFSFIGAFVLGLATGVMAGLWLVSALSMWCPMNSYAKSEAVKAGKAEYYLDANNERQWRWKP